MSVRRVSRILLMLCVCSAAPAWAQEDAPHPPPPKKAMRQYKGMGKKGPWRLPPGARIDALERMTPEQQERFLSTLPPPRRAEALRLLQKWREMTPEERRRARQTLGEFRGLPPEQQRRVRMLFVQFNSLPSERQPVLRNELAELRRLNPAERGTRMGSDEFRKQYSPVEQRLLADLSEALPKQYREEEEQ
jgi:hypothetical protein